MASQVPIEVMDQFTLEKQSLQKQISMLANVNDQYLDRIRELESKVEERDVRINFLSKQCGSYDMLKKTYDELSRQHEELQASIREFSMKNTKEFASYQQTENTNNELLQAILDKVGGKVHKGGEQENEEEKEQEKPKKFKRLERFAKIDSRFKEPNVTYTEFKDLKNFEDTPNDEHPFRKDQAAYMNTFLPSLIEDPDKWENLFEALTIIRIINKYYPDVLLANLQKLSPFLKESVDNFRSNIAKNALMFCAEFLAIEEIVNSEQRQNFKNMILPSIFARTVDDKSFISKEATKAVQNCIKCSNNNVDPETLVIMIKEGCQSQNKKIVEQSYVDFLKTYIGFADFSNPDHKFLIDGGQKSQLLMSTLGEGFDSSIKVKKATIEIIKMLDTKIKESNDKSLLPLEELLKKGLKNDEAKVSSIMKIFSAPVKSESKTSRFRSFLKQKRSQKKENEEEDKDPKSPVAVEVKMLSRSPSGAKESTPNTPNAK